MQTFILVSTFSAKSHGFPMKMEEKTDERTNNKYLKHGLKIIHTVMTVITDIWYFVDTETSMGEDSTIPAISASYVAKTL